MGVIRDQPLFEGYREGLEQFLTRLRSNHYVYELYRPTGEVFYVGKGQNRRVVEHELEAIRHHPIGETNPFKCNVIRKILREGGRVGYRIVKVFDTSAVADCMAHETDLIKKYGRRHEGGPLTNLAGGTGSISGAAPYSLQKHAATLSGAPDNNPDRATLNVFLQGIGAVGSVPIKPANQIARILHTTPHPNSTQPTRRCAYALIASATANGLQLTGGVRVPRSFVYDGVRGIIENGVARDLTKAKMAALIAADDPQQEVFRLDADQCHLLADLVGGNLLSDLGLV